MIINDNKIIFINKREIRKNYKKLAVSKFGYHSNIYSMNNDEIIKLFKKKATLEQLQVMDIIKSYDGTLFSKPLLLVEVNNKIIGYTMKNLDGDNINFLSDNVELDEMFNFFDDKVDKQIHKLCQDKLKIWDITFYNVLYDDIKKEFHFIDTDSYKIEKKMSEEELYIYNVSEIIDIIFKMLFYSNLTKEVFLEHSKKMIVNGENIKNILFMTKEYLEDINIKKIITLNDFNNAEEILVKKLIKRTYF